MTGMANAAAMTQMIQRDFQNMQLIQPGVQQYNNDALNYGAKAGYINRDEYVNLGNYMNETNRLKGIYEKNGLSPQERETLANRQRQYDQMYQRFSYGDFHPRTTARDGIQGRQLNQLNRTYSGLRNGSVTMNEGQNLLQQQQGISRQKGVYQRSGSWGNNRLNFYERNALHNRLDNSSYNINRSRNNWRSDWSVPLFWGMF